MATKIKILHAANGTATPPALEEGELAINALATPLPQLWTGVPTSVDPSGKLDLFTKWLPLTGGTLSNPGDLNVGGTLTGLKWQPSPTVPTRYWEFAGTDDMRWVVSSMGTPVRFSLTVNAATFNGNQVNMNTLSGGNPHILGGLTYDRFSTLWNVTAGNTGAYEMLSGAGWNTINFYVGVNRTIGTGGSGPIVLALRNDGGFPSASMPQGGSASGFFSAYAGLASHAPSGMYAPRGQYPLSITSLGADVPGVDLGGGVYDSRGTPGFDFSIDADWVGTGPRDGNTGWMWSRFRCGTGGGWTLQAEYQRNDPSPSLGTIDRFWIGRGATGSFGYNGRQALRPAYPHIMFDTLYATGLGGGELTLSATNLIFEGIPILADRAQPAAPRVGMLWYDTTGNALKFYHAATWNTVWPSSGGGGGIPEPTVAGNFLRTNTSAWVAGLPLTGDTMVGPISWVIGDDVYRLEDYFGLGVGLVVENLFGWPPNATAWLVYNDGFSHYRAHFDIPVEFNDSVVMPFLGVSVASINTLYMPSSMTPPASAAPGTMYYNSTTGLHLYHNGAWRTVQVA